MAKANAGGYEMARSKGKIQPAVKTLEFTLPEGVSFLDLSQCGSALNRRFLRQGLNWLVGGFTVSLPATSAGAFGRLTISKLPDTWACSNSWHKAYAAWNRQQKDALRDAGLQSTVARYRDFKIHMNQAHQAAGFGTNLVPVDLDGAAIPFGEWFASEIVIPNDGGVAGNTVEYNLHMVGADNASSKGLIQNYAHSRATPFSPDPDVQDPTASFYSEMIDLGEIQEDVVDNAVHKNQDLPYPKDDYPGGAIIAPTTELIHYTHFSATTVSIKNRLAGSNVPCGLLSFKNELTNLDPGLDSIITLVIHLVPGPARGYLTQKMQDM